MHIVEEKVIAPPSRFTCSACASEEENSDSCSSAESESIGREFIISQAEEDDVELFIENLHAFAYKKVEENRQAIVENLRSVANGLSPLVLDIGLPGTAYFSVAAGGMAEVLHLLGEEIVQVDRFTGASGGACSCFLILANQEVCGRGPARCPSSEVLLRSYWEYAFSQGTGAMTRFTNAVKQIFRINSFWRKKYEALLEHDASWEAIRERAFCAVSARPLRWNAGIQSKKTSVPKDLTKISKHEDKADNYVMHDFSSKAQAVEAYVSTGELTAFGLWSGLPVTETEFDKDFGPEDKAFAMLSKDGREQCKVLLPKTFCDGGRPVAFGVLDRKVPPSLQSRPDKSKNSFLFYNTWFGNYDNDVFVVSPQSIDRLFRKGVETTINCLKSPDLQYNPSGEERMVIALPDSTDALPEECLNGTFVSLSRAELCHIF